MFLLNSCLDLFSAPCPCRDPLSRSYEVNLPSSLTVNLSSALVYSTRPRVSVSVRVPHGLLSGFSWESDYLRYPRARRLAVLSSSASSTDLPMDDLPTLFNGLFRQSAAVSLLRPRVAPCDSNGILTVSSIRFALRLPVRSRLTLNRLALFRNPWSFGVEVSRLHYRYLYLHLLFHTLQQGSRLTFAAVWNAPLPIDPLRPIPWLRYRTYARLLSTRDHSTSELLRTL